MSISPERMTEALQELGLTVETDGENFIHTTGGRFAPVISTIITIDEDGSAATLMTALSEIIDPQYRAKVCELLNLVHGQSLWNVRFHLDETGRVLSIGKHLMWGKPFNGVQFGDIFFSLLVTTDRLYPCLIGVTKDGLTVEEAFERFFLNPPDLDEGTPEV